MGIAVVQSVIAAGSSVSSITTPGISTTSGNLIIVDLSYIGTFLSQSDSPMNSYSNAIAEAGGATLCRENYSNGITGNASHTFTLELTASGFPTIVAVEVSGQSASSVLDQTAVGSDATGDTHTTANTSATSQANELLHGYGIGTVVVGTTFSVSAPWTQDKENDLATSSGIISASKNVTSIGTYNFTFRTNIGSLRATQSGISTWKEATGGGGATLSQLIVDPNILGVGIVDGGIVL